jgi:hypothetical protein
MVCGREPRRIGPTSMPAFGGPAFTRSYNARCDICWALRDRSSLTPQRLLSCLKGPTEICRAIRYALNERPRGAVSTVTPPFLRRALSERPSRAGEAGTRAGAGKRRAQTDSNPPVICHVRAGPRRLHSGTGPIEAGRSNLLGLRSRIIKSIRKNLDTHAFGRLAAS